MVHRKHFLKNLELAFYLNKIINHLKSILFLTKKLKIFEYFVKYNPRKIRNLTSQAPKLFSKLHIIIKLSKDNLTDP